MARTGNRRLPDRVALREARRAFAGRLWRAFLQVGGLSLCFCGLSVGGRAVHRWLFTSATFAVDQLEVVGARRFSAEKLRELSGLRLGVNVFRADLGEAERLVTLDPWIRVARATRHPPRRLTLEVEERRAVALVDLGGLYLVDDRGEVFKRAHPSDGLDLPLISGISRVAFAVRREEAHREIGQALLLLSELRRRAGIGSKGNALSKISEVHCDELDGLTVYLGPGPLAVRLGSELFGDAVATAQAPAKLDRLERALALLSRRGLRPAALDLTDVEHPDRVAVRLVGSAEASEGAKHRTHWMH